MLKYTTVLVDISYPSGSKTKQVDITSTEVLHEVEIYEKLEQLFPLYIKLVTTEDDYEVVLNKGANSVTILRH